MMSDSEGNVGCLIILEIPVNLLDQNVIFLLRLVERPNEPPHIHINEGYVYYYRKLNNLGSPPTFIVKECIKAGSAQVQYLAVISE